MEIFLNEENPDTLCLTEHNLKNNEFQVIKLRNFETASAFCRESKHGGGGSCIFVKKGIDYKIVDVSSYCCEGIIEMSAISINIPTISKLILTVYRPPNSKCDYFLISLVNVLILF